MTDFHWCTCMCHGIPRRGGCFLCSCNTPTETFTTSTSQKIEIDKSYETMINNKLKLINERLERLEKLSSTEKKPHKCPVCEGKYFIYLNPLEYLNPYPFRNKFKCSSCEKGIIWG